MWSLSAVLARYLMAFSLLAAAAAPMTPEEEAAYRIGFVVGIFLGAFIGGAIVGLLPLIVGLRRGRRAFAFASWASCIVANFVFGIFLSLPLAVVLTIVALCLPRREAEAPITPQAFRAVPNVYEGAPVRIARVEPPEYAGSPGVNR